MEKLKIFVFLFVRIVQVAIIASLAVVNAALRPIAPVLGQDVAAQIVRSESVVNPDSFQYAYETSNGIQAKAGGQLKQVGSESAVVHNGDYSYTAPDGQQYALTYVADENGYQPTVRFFPLYAIWIFFFLLQVLIIFNRMFE